MPEIQHRKIKPSLGNITKPSTKQPDYFEFQVFSNFSFLRGASHAEELIQRAKELGLKGLALTDLNSVAGIVRAHLAAKQNDFKFFVGCTLELIYEPSLEMPEAHVQILVYPKNLNGYANLCRLLTLGKRRTTKAECLLSIEDFFEYQTDLVATIVAPKHNFSNLMQFNFYEVCKNIKENYYAKELLSFALTKSYANNALRHFQANLEVAQKLNIPVLATNDVYYHAPERKALQDLLTCIKNKCSIKQAGFLLEQNSERFLKAPLEIARIFRELPQALRRSVELAEILSDFSLDQLRYEYPAEICPQDKNPHQYLSELTWQGALERYKGTPQEKIKSLIVGELALIKELNYEKYFLTCYDIVKFARSRGILCQGRGAAANSAVCFCLGITSVNPNEIDLLFARFISKERDEPPDIDIDFEHERREEVIQYIYQKFGRERAALTAEVITYRQRSAFRELAKALGFSLDIADKLAKSIHRWTDYALAKEDLDCLGLSFEEHNIQNLLNLSKQILGFPRHLSQHVGGFIISEKPLCEIVPILNAAMPDRTTIEWDKYDIEALGMLKIDVLGLGMLTCIRKTLQLVNKRRLHEGLAHLELHTIPQDDPKVYQMIQASDTIGVFQIESRAQMSMLPRLKPRCFYDLVIEVAIVRPGPIQGNMVHPYLKRRSGLEKVTFPDKRVEAILGKTLGVPIFQEQAMRLVIELADFSPGEAEKLRRAMAAWKHNGGAIEKFTARILEGMKKKGYSEAFAQSCINQIKGFSEYGFPESHAASFALLVYASAWLKAHYPAEFAVGLLNSQPMGFYGPAQIVQDAKNHNVLVKPIDVNKSLWDCTLENGAMRLGMRLVKGLAQKQAELIVRAVKSYGEFNSIIELWHKANLGQEKLSKVTLQILARADAFNSMGLDRRKALWEIHALPKIPLPLEKYKQEKVTYLKQEGLQQSMFKDYEYTGLSLKAHPISFLRAAFLSKQVKTKISTALELKEGKNNLVCVIGMLIFRQRPSTAKGTVFLTLEDETGICNLIVRANIFEKYQREILGSQYLLAKGVLQNIGEVVYINAREIISLSKPENSPENLVSYKLKNQCV